MHSHLRVWFTLWLGLSLVTTAQAARHAVLIGVDYQDCRPASPGITCPPPLQGPPHIVCKSVLPPGLEPVGKLIRKFNSHVHHGLLRSQQRAV